MIEVDISLLEANGREVWREGGAGNYHGPGGFNGYVSISFALAFENIAPVDKSAVKVIENVQLSQNPRTPL